MAKTKETSELSGFEADFERLGAIVAKLEEGNSTLEEMMTLYEEGTALAAKLSGTLRTAELRVEKLAKIHEELSTFEVEPLGD